MESLNERSFFQGDTEYFFSLEHAVNINKNYQILENFKKFLLHEI